MQTVLTMIGDATEPVDTCIQWLDETRAQLESNG